MTLRCRYLGLVAGAMAALTMTAARAETAPVDCEAIYDWPGHGRVFYETNPTYHDPAGVYAWPTASPREMGVDAALLDPAIKGLLASPTAAGVLVVRNGKVIAERYANGSAADQANNIHSASKSMLSALVGIAIREGLIDSVDQKVADFLPSYLDDGDADKARITIAHLLTMSAGLAWEEDATEYAIEDEADWVGAILARPVVTEPGESFRYSTGLTHVLSAVLTSATGLSTCAFAHRYLFGPMGITAEHWGRDPQGIQSGGYNLYMTPREMAAFGQLYLQGGSWHGAQIVPADWVATSLRPQQVDDDVYRYGYLWWLRDLGGHDTAIAWGWGGQLIYVVADLDLVVVITSDTSDDLPMTEIEGFANRAHQFVRDAVIPSVE